MPLAAPRSLSPSKVSSFTDCPLAFRFTIIDRLPEPPSPHAVKGTLVHTALERLVWEHPPGRRSEEAALAELSGAWRSLQQGPEYAELALSGDEAAEFLADAEALVRNYFSLEDPDRVRAVGVELGLEVDVGGVRLRGIIDRLDLNDDGELVVVDYKTGRAPSQRFEQARLTGVHIYALLCELLLGRTPVEVRLLHLRDPMTIVAIPTEQSVRGQMRRTLAVWSAIERACEREDFRPRPSSLCQFCNFQAFCPAFGGELPAAVAS
jgi:putative RecB family exonuclease